MRAVVVVEIPLPPKNQLAERYRDHKESYERLLFELQRRTQTALRNCGLGANIKYRVKSFDSYYEKLRRLSRSLPPGATAVSITDLVALRIVCPFLEDVALAERCLRSQFQVSEIDRKGSEFSVREFGYESVHCLIRAPEDVVQGFHLQSPLECEVQIRTILQDAWAEVEHELVYKADFTPFEEGVRRKLAALNANLSLSDITFQEIRDYQRRLHQELQKRRRGFWAVVGKATGGASPDGSTPTIQTDLGDPEGVTFGFSRISGADRAPGETMVGPRSAWSDGLGGMDTLLLEALRAHNEGDFPRADEVYSRILLSQPRPYVQAIVLLHRGIARMAAERYGEALDDVNVALHIDSTNQRGRFYRGVLLQITGDEAAAEREFNECLCADPYQVECLFQRARLFGAQSRYDEARRDCDRALDIDPTLEAVRSFRDGLPPGRSSA